jgi:hypothetical protein
MEDGFRKASILCETSNFASNPLHAFFALQHCHVDVLYSLNHVAKSSGFFTLSNFSLLSVDSNSGN